MPSFFKKKTPLTYEEAHNKAFWRYQKSSQILVWTGILNFIGLIIAIIQLNTTEQHLFNPFLCYSSNIFAFKSLMLIPNLNQINFVWYLLVFAIALISSVGMILLGVYAQQGKKKHLFAGVSIYIFDLFCTLLLIFIEDSYASLWLIAGIHVIVIAFLMVAIFEYFNIIKIAVKYGVIKEKEQNK
jgi:hypothetical protein